MRQLVLSPRWILWHLLALSATTACGLLAAWQWSRAGSAMGSALNVGYGLQWPLFAVFFAVMWWRMLRMEAARIRAAADGPGPGEAVGAGATPVTAPAAGSPAPTAPGGSSAGTAETSSSQPAPAGRSSRPAGAGRSSRPVDASGVVEPAGTGGSGSAAGAAPAEPSPFGPRPAWARPAPVEEGSGLAAYNRMLAELAARPQD